MSIKNVEKLLNLAKSNTKLQKELILINEKLQKEGGDEEKVIADNVVPLAKKNGIIFTANDFLQYANEQMSALSEEDLLTVSGGVSARNTAAALLVTFLGSLGVGATVNLLNLSQEDNKSVVRKAEKNNGEDSRNNQDEVNTNAQNAADKMSTTAQKTDVDEENNNENEAQSGENVAHNDNEASKINEAEQENRRDVMQNKNVVLPNSNAKNTPTAPQINVAPPQVNAAKMLGKNNVTPLKANTANTSAKNAATTTAPGAVEAAEHAENVGGRIIDYAPFRRWAISVVTQAEHLIKFLNKLPRTSNGLPDLRYVSEETRAKLENDIIHVVRQFRLNNVGEIIMQGGYNPYQEISEENAEMLLGLGRDTLTSQRVTPDLVLEALTDLRIDESTGLPDLNSSDAELISDALKTARMNLSDDQINSSGISAKEREMLSALRQRAVAEVKRDAEDSQEKRVSFAPGVVRKTTTIEEQKEKLKNKRRALNKRKSETKKNNSENVASAEHDKAAVQTENNLEAFKEMLRQKGIKSGNKKYERFDFGSGGYLREELIEHILNALDNFENLDAKSQRGLMLDTAVLLQGTKSKGVYEDYSLYNDVEDDIEELNKEIVKYDGLLYDLMEKYSKIPENKREEKEGKELEEKFKQTLAERRQKINERDQKQKELEKLKELVNFYFEKVEPNYEDTVKPTNDFEELVALSNVEFEKLEDFLDRLAPHINKFDSLDPESKAVLLGYIDNFFYRYSDFIYNKETKEDEIRLRADYNKNTKAIVEKMIEIGKNNIFNQGKEFGNQKFSAMDYVKAAGATIVFAGAVAAYSIVVNLPTWVDFFFPAQPKKVHDPRQEITTEDKLLADAETTLINAKNKVTSFATKAVNKVTSTATEVAKKVKSLKNWWYGIDDTTGDLSPAQLEQMFLEGQNAIKDSGTTPVDTPHIASEGQTSATGDFTVDQLDQMFLEGQKEIQKSQPPANAVSHENLPPTEQQLQDIYMSSKADIDSLNQGTSRPTHASIARPLKTEGSGVRKITVENDFSKIDSNVDTSLPINVANEVIDNQVDSSKRIDSRFLTPSNSEKGEIHEGTVVLQKAGLPKAEVPKSTANKEFKSYSPQTQENLNRANAETITQPGKSTSTAVANVNIPDSSTNIKKLAKRTEVAVFNAGSSNKEVPQTSVPQVDYTVKGAKKLDNAAAEMPKNNPRIDLTMPAAKNENFFKRLYNRFFSSSETKNDAATSLNSTGAFENSKNFNMGDQKSGTDLPTTFEKTLTFGDDSFTKGSSSNPATNFSNQTILRPQYGPELSTNADLTSNEGEGAGTTWKDTFKSAADTVKGYIPQKVKDVASVAYNKLPSGEQVGAKLDEAQAAVKDLSKVHSLKDAGQYVSDHPNVAKAAEGMYIAGGTIAAGAVVGKGISKIANMLSADNDDAAQNLNNGVNNNQGGPGDNSSEESPGNVKALVNYLNTLPKIDINGTKLPDLTAVPGENLINLKEAIFDAGENMYYDNNDDSMKIVDETKFINADKVTPEDLKMLERLHFSLWFSTPKCLVNEVLNGNLDEDGVPELGDGDNDLFKLGIAKVADKVTKENGTGKYIISESVWDYTNNEIPEPSQDDIEMILNIKNKYNLKVEDFIKKEAAPPEGEKEEAANNNKIFDISSGDEAEEENVDDNINGGGTAIPENLAQKIVAIARDELDKQKEEKKVVSALAPVQPAAPAPASAGEGGEEKPALQPVVKKKNIKTTKHERMNKNKSNVSAAPEEKPDEDLDDDAGSAAAPAQEDLPLTYEEAFGLLRFLQARANLSLDRRRKASQLALLKRFVRTNLEELRKNNKNPVFSFNNIAFNQKAEKNVSQKNKTLSQILQEAAYANFADLINES